eukprot:TRINITY_DN67737_c10_g1_i1.p1 TRINITY_DN67737_c10_g1~~TRINITY_DN67737_c10_g1_i1.p1  ORF type:complete len:542 (+),score=14.47 TRINITY_DN67737_c10_g1_i1:69-1694(+)
MNQHASEDELIDLDQREEQLAFLRIEAAFRYYREYALKIMNFKRRHYEKVLPKHKTLLPGYETHFENMRRCIDTNATFLDYICDYSTQRMFYMYWPEGPVVSVSEKPTAADMDKVLTTLRQFVRDWSAEGQPERDQCYGLLLNKLESIFPDIESRSDIKVLIPGSGLSRLAYEIFSRGFYSQGNEFSHHMLIAGSFVLNNIPQAAQYHLHPYVHHICNNRSREDMLRSVAIPDVSPIEESNTNRLMQKGSFSMCAGDFLEVYGKPREKSAWNSVVTCFFIDTAHNIFQYVETIFSLLVVGGVWLNIGPLLYHFADQPNELSIELAWTDLRKIIEGFGFDIIEEQTIECTYTANPRALMYNVHRCIYFQAIKTDRLPHLTYLLHESVDACNAFRNKGVDMEGKAAVPPSMGPAPPTQIPPLAPVEKRKDDQPPLPTLPPPHLFGGVNPLQHGPQVIPAAPLLQPTLDGVSFPPTHLPTQAHLHAAAAHMQATLLQAQQPPLPTPIPPTTTTTHTPEPHPMPTPPVAGDDMDEGGCKKRARPD